jgi:glycopeptide antibiotics resistance protein
MLAVFSYYLVSEYCALHTSQDRYNNLLNFLILLTLLTFIQKKFPSKWKR